MDIDILDLEKRLKENSRNSTEELLQYVLFEIQSPIEDYFLAVDILTDNYFKNRDIRLAILGAYLSSTWFSFKENRFLELLDEHLSEADDQNKAIIWYLHAYDMYIRCDGKYPREYSDYLQKSISHSKRFVYNYVRLSEVSEMSKARALLDRAISNIETVWTEEQLKKVPKTVFLKYENFIDEFILGVDISIFEYKDLVAKRKLI